MPVGRQAGVQSRFADPHFQDGLDHVSTQSLVHRRAGDLREERRVEESSDHWGAPETKETQRIEVFLYLNRPSCGGKFQHSLQFLTETSQSVVSDCF